MNDKCPKCGALKSTQGELPVAATFGCGATCDGSYQSHHCALCQIAALESRCEKLERMLREMQHPYYGERCKKCGSSVCIYCGTCNYESKCLPDCELAQLLKGA